MPQSADYRAVPLQVARHTTEVQRHLGIGLILLSNFSDEEPCLMLNIRNRALQFLTIFILIIGLVASALRANAQAVSRMPNGVMVHSGKGIVQVEVCSDRVVHILASATVMTERTVVPTVIRPCAGAAFTSSSDDAGFHIRTSKLRIDIDRDTGSVRFLTPEGDDILSEKTRDWQTTGPSEAGDSPNGIEQNFQLLPGEALYGLGQHQEGFLNVRDIPVRLLQANTNIAIPFLISTKGYGLLWNNAALTDFNPATEAIPLDGTGAGTFRTGQEGEYGFLLSGNDRSKLRLSVDGQQIIDIKNMWVAGSAGAKIHLAANTTYKVMAESGGNTKLSVRAPSDTMAFRSETGEGVDYYFIYGPEPAQIIAQYRDFTGAAPLLPRWAYGFWQCRERYSNQQQILDTAAEFRKRKIPVDVLVQDWQYWGRYGWNAMRFDERDYPDPAEMMSSLHRQNFHLIISVWAKFGAETAVNREMKDAHLLLMSAASTGDPGETKETESWADLFNPSAQKAFWSDIDRNLFAAGLDGWWLDASEPEGDPLKNDQTFLGPGKTVRNAFPLFETSAVYDGQRATTADKRVVILSRSAYTGQQRTGSISWSGDISGNWETFRRQIPAGLGFGMTGFPYWTTDIGGFFRPMDQYTSADYHELLIRWFQFGAFCPIFRIHGYRSETELWKYGPEVEKILTQYDQLRYRLLPYIYSASWGVTDRGEILMKALPFEYPSDPALRDIGDQFLFGDSLLVNPVTVRNATTRDVVLPSGDDWVDFWTGQVYGGGRAIQADAPLDRMPILVRQGSIVPLGPVVQSAAEPQEPLDIRIYAGKDADFQLYEDAGDGYAYEYGARTVIHLHWDNRQNALVIGDRSGTFLGMKPKRIFRIVLVKPGHGVGAGSDSEADRTVTYLGHQMRVSLGKAS
jgi:alpha-D-xyloside xylohydrolase